MSRKRLSERGTSKVLTIRYATWDLRDRAQKEDELDSTLNEKHIKTESKHLETQ